MYRKILAGLLIVAGSLLVASPATADPTGCHGNSGRYCVADPNPNGQDCAAHGNNPDGNANHCVPQTVIDTDIDPVVVTDPVIDSTTPVVDDPIRYGIPVSVDDYPVVIDDSGVPTYNGVPLPTYNGVPFMPDGPLPGGTTEIGTALVLTKPQPLTELPRTGGTLLLVSVGLILVVMGVGLKLLAAKPPLGAEL